MTGLVLTMNIARWNLSLKVCRKKVGSENLMLQFGLLTKWSNLVAVTDCGDANSRFLGLVSCGGSTIIRSNDIQTVCHQKNLSNDVKHITHMQSVLAKIMEMDKKLVQIIWHH